MKILILSCSTGGGHNSCANYIKEELSLNNIECDFIDFFDIFAGKAKKISSDIYLKTLGNNGKIFKNVYKAGELVSKSKLQSPVYLFNKMFKKKLYNYIKDNNYTLVITTHLFPSLTLTSINNDKKYTHIPFLFVATDYEPCPFMEEAKPEYFIMQKTLEKKFIKKGIEESKLLNTGIPISSNFIKNSISIRENYNIKKDEKIILIMLGSMGFGHIEKIISPLLNEKLKIIVICGTNKDLYENLSKQKNENLIVIGFTKNINDFIYSADFVLSKPGGLSSTEIASFHKPLLHIFPIPGIETYNTLFFENNKMSIKCDTDEEIIKNLKYLMNNDDVCQEMIENQKKIINENSASDLVKFILDHFN